jgi:hypothetical protein
MSVRADRAEVKAGQAAGCSSDDAIGLGEDRRWRKNEKKLWVK